MPKVKLSGPQKEIVEVLGHIMAVSDISANVEGMSGYLDSYIKNLPDRQRAIYQAVKDCIQGYFSDTQTCDMRKFISCWARARRAWCDYTGEALV